MSLHYKDKCLVCLKTGGNLNIFTTYNISDEKEELYVDVIKKCFNIEITQDSGLHEMCNDCSLKLRHAYEFRHSIVAAVNKLVLAKVSETDKPYSKVPYSEEITYENNYDVQAVLKTDDVSCDLDKIGDSEDYCIFDLENYDGKNDRKNLQVVNNEESHGKADLINLNETAIIPFNIEEKTDSANHVTYFMDINNDLLEVNIPLSNDDHILKQDIEKDDILSGNDEPYSLSILNENDLNTFLMEESDIKVLNIGGNNYKNISKNNNDMKPETAINTDVNYIPFVFNDGIDKETCFVNVADLIIKDVNKVNKTKPKATRKVVRKYGKKTDVKNHVNDALEKIKENKPNVNNIATGKIAENSESQVKPKKAVKRKGKSKTDDEIRISSYLNDENNGVSMNGNNDLLEKEAKGRKGKRTAKKNLKKDVDTVKENVPDEDVKPKRRRKGSKDDPKPLIMPGQTKCDICSAEFETTAQLSAHAATHPSDYACDVCGLKFERKFKYTIHMRSHNKGPHFCKFCNQEFSNVNTRNTHEWRVHSKPEPFKCSHCGERFKTYLKRLRHLQSVHQDNTQYPCNFCGKSFAYAAYRSRHIQTMHLNKREYKCENCPAAFARRSGLDRHLACKHGVGEMKYQCHICQQNFFVRPALRWHVAHIHNR